MTDNVHQLFRENQFAPTTEAIAAYLEQLAGKIRAGEFPITRGVIIAQADDQPGCAVVPFGAPTNTMMLVGLIQMGQLRAALDT